MWSQKKKTCELHLHFQQLKSTLFFFLMKQIKFEQREDSISFCGWISRHSSQNFENHHCQLLKTQEVESQDGFMEKNRLCRKNWV